MQLACRARVPRENFTPEDVSSLQRLDFSEKEGGRTQAFAVEMEKIGAGEVIEEGIRPIWKGKGAREKLEKENGRCGGFIGGKKEEQACAEWIQEGLRTEVLTKLTADQVGCLNNIFFIPKKNGKFRQILDCRPLNSALKDVHFKMDDHRTVEKLLQKEDWATSLDLSQANFLIQVHREFTHFLAFKFRGDFFGFREMLFGYKDAPRVFPKVMRKAMMQERKRWRVRWITHLDDMLFFIRIEIICGNGGRRLWNG
ncbi:putative reverse transcriptase [Monocercomonoides exilis]|uniref:putative reverse transcriptase n=1 Tax=Monocercomonoides exilis TaxID=2049356 RepID=UPI00355AC46B|nr:putative reverse transcriptase [Monocercomonoides exilis]|eukprot:MONOS_8424.1-p1 / transcript=MONOS_8424.1 / gene=MONOS_8424 / organism=Monocercomonoides_exilis_PA203 / gene_product=reverse transcriptase / transcript_product=reverse transcriptase / location=Mono_scaffold00317:17709-18473(-) / protein_length=254 / sequence_SO=supercontig / SO=protein_coding / is_pseudo=false